MVDPRIVVRTLAVTALVVPVVEGTEEARAIRVAATFHGNSSVNMARQPVSIILWREAESTEHLIRRVVAQEAVHARKCIVYHDSAFDASFLGDYIEELFERSFKSKDLLDVGALR